MIHLKEVSKNFGEKNILKDIDLTINPSEITFIVGSSGAGKSTLLNLIGGLDAVSSGSIRYNDEDITKDLTTYRAKNVGFIFQDYNLISGLSVEKNIELAMFYSDIEKNIFQIGKHIDEMRIKDKNQSVETLSGGEKQRAAIIRSICKDSEIIIADEPTGNLDSENARIVFEYLVEMKAGKHIIVVSHDLDMAHKYGDRIITISDGKIINDVRQVHNEVSDEKFVRNPEIKRSSRKQKVNWKTVFMLGINSFKIRFAKILSISLVIALAISALAMIFDFNNVGNRVSKNVNVNYLENDLISVFYSYTANIGYKETPFSESDIEHIRSKYGAKEIVPVYMEQDTWFFSNGNLTKQAVIKQININSFFNERIMSYDIQGEFVKEENEIILADDVAEYLFGDSDCIGSEIALNDGSGESVVFKITGINKTINPFDKTYSIVSSMKIKELFEKRLNMLKNNLELNEFSDEEVSEEISVTTGGIHAPMKEIEGSEQCIYGHLPQNKTEIMLSSALLPYALSGLNIQTNYHESDILNNSLPESVINELTGKKIALKYNGLFQLNITGIYESDQVEIRFSPALINEDLKNIEPTVLEIYLPSELSVTQLKDKINSDEEFTCFLQLENLKNSVSEQTNYFKWAIIIVGLIMLLVSVSMIGSFGKLVVLERKKEVAIIKSLGATNRAVMFTLWFDTISISIIAFLISLVFTGVFVTAIPHIISNVSFINFRYPIVPLIILGICFMVFVCFYTLLSLRKLVRVMPAELFKQ